MKYQFIIADNAKTSAKEKAFAVAYGYQEYIQNENMMVANPETPHEFCERTLKRIFLEPWASGRAQTVFNNEFKTSIED